MAKSFADLFDIKTSDEFVSSIRHPDFRPFSTNAVVRKNLLQALMLLRSAPLSKETKIENKRYGGRNQDNVY